MTEKKAERHQLEDKATQSQIDARKWLVDHRNGPAAAAESASAANVKVFDASGRVAKVKEKKGGKKRT